MTNKKTEESKQTEQIVEDTIKYANNEITRIKKNYLIKGIIFLAIILLIISLFIFIFKHEMSIHYSDKMIEVILPEDKGLDLKINLSNYSAVKTMLVKADDESYDLYINVTRTLVSNLFKDKDKSNNLLRVGNGMIVDFQSETLRSYIPNGLDTSVIKHIYYIDNLLNKTETMDDNKLIDYKDKILIWER